MMTQVHGHLCAICLTNPHPIRTSLVKCYLCSQHWWHEQECLTFFDHYALWAPKTFLIRSYIHLIFHKKLISIPDLKRFYKVLVSGCCVVQTSTSMWHNIFTKILYSTYYTVYDAMGIHPQSYIIPSYRDETFHLI